MFELVRGHLGRTLASKIRCPGLVPSISGAISKLGDISAALNSLRCSVASASGAGRLRILCSITSIRLPSDSQSAPTCQERGANWSPRPSSASCSVLHAMSRRGAEDRPEPTHSYYRYWYYGCRCRVCRAANAAKSARLRQQRLAVSNDFPAPTRSTSTSKHAKRLLELPRQDLNLEPAG